MERKNTVQQELMFIISLAFRKVVLLGSTALVLLLKLSMPTLTSLWIIWQLVTADRQMRAFANAEGEGTGSLHNDFNLLGMGDILFNLNKKGEATHTMVATGEVKTDRNGNVTKYQTIEATESGDKVRTKWRNVKSSQRIGHTFRRTDDQNVGPIRDSKDRIKLSGFVNKYQNVVD